MKTRKYKNFGIGLFLALALSFSVLFSLSYKVAAAGENYIFYYKNSDEKSIENALSGNVFNNPTGSSGLVSTSVYAKNGLFGGSPYAFYFDTQASQAEGKPVYSAEYYCTKSGFKFSNSFKEPGDIKVTLNILPKLTKSTIEDQNHLIPGSLSMANAAEMSNGGKDVAFDYGTDLSLVPSQCLPQGTKTHQSIGLANYTHLTSDAKKDWPNVQTTSEHDAPGLTLPGGTTTTTANDGDACEGASNSGLEWVMCAGLRAIGGFADVVNNLIENQLNFDVNQNLNPHVKQAWRIFSIISTVLLVVILLVMILAQASGGGPFEAYTVRKILPKIVIAIIAIQLSWVMFRYVIILANDTGKGIQDLLALPFGGHDQIQLDKLVGDLGWAAPGATLLVGLLATTAALIVNPFGALMLAFLVAVGILLAFAVLLFRQALIIGCVIFAPIALIAWILPGTNRYWKMWWENFYKALLLFPIIAAMIIIGRVFAWIVANGGGDPGPLDLFAVILGFFGPYFLFPKAFSWGGSLMRTAANGIESGLKPVRNVGKEEIKGMKERWQGKRASLYDPDKNRQGKIRRAGLRLQSGNFIPTERGRRLTIQKGEKWKGERDEEAQAMMKRQYDMGLREGYWTTNPETGKKEKIDPGLKAAKQGLVDMVGYDGNDDNKKRAAKMAIEELLRTQSFWEMQNAYIQTEGKYKGKRVMDTDVWQNRMETNPDAWGAVSAKRPDAIPTVTDETYNKYGDQDMDVMRTIAHYAPEEYKESSQGDEETDEQYAARTKAEWQGQKGQAYRSRNKDYLASRLKQVRDLQGDLGSDARLDDADRITKALRQGYADAQHSPGYAEGWWDEIIAQAKKGNVAAQRDMLNQLTEVAGTGQAGLGVLNNLAAGPLRQKVNRALGGGQNNDILGNLIQMAKTTDETNAATIKASILSPQATGVAQASTAAPARAQTPSTAAPAAAPAPQPAGGGNGGRAPSMPEEGTLTINHDALADSVARGVREALRTTPEASRFSPGRPGPGQLFHPEGSAPQREEREGLVLPTNEEIAQVNRTRNNS